MSVGTVRITVEDFERLAAQPENADRRFEFVGGEVVEVVSNSYASQVAFTVGFHIKLHLRDTEQQGHITGADGGFQVGDERYIPDVGYVSQARQAQASRETYNPNTPDLAVEVLSPTDQPHVMRIKIANYLAAGVVVWVVDPATKTVEVYAPGQSAQKLGVEDTLNGGDVLPGFALAISEIFPA